MPDSDPLPSASGTPRSDGLPSLAPDFVEQDSPETLENVIPSRGYHMMPMVGLGGSAGSIGALQEFFQSMPPDTGMVFVVILHLAPARDSSLAELLARSTTMPVVQAEDGVRVSPNTVYVIPPARDLVAIDGHLRLNPLEVERGRRVVVDLFLRSLADTHGPHAAAIILSGADGDGALGIKRIKERGGLTVVQDPDEAEHGSMPRTAIATGMIDWVMRVRDIPARLVNYMQAGRVLRLPPEEGPPPAEPAAQSADRDESALHDVLGILRSRTGRDFTYYKRATILRRIARRLQVNNLEDMPAYLAYLRTHPGEAGALLQDLLISVTNFFRDRDAFAAVEALIPRLFEGKTQGDSVRVWVPACATGEEAYSMAMLLLEQARRMELPPSLQVFACDLDEEAITQARAGLYPEVMVADVSEERIKRFFVREHGGYRVRRELREMVLFASHDLLKDAPFSRMDLISCRNLLIYLNRQAQQRVFEIFHFALRPGGFLFLGSSESVDEASALFHPVDKKNRLYASQPAARMSLPAVGGTGSLLRILESRERVSAAPVVHGRHFPNELPFPPLSAAPGGLRDTLAEMHFKLIERLAPPSVIVNAEHEIVHLSESVGRFLRFTAGEPTNNLLRLVDPAVRVELRSALFRCAETGVPTSVPNLPLPGEGAPRRLTLQVTPATDVFPGFLLVTFETREAPEAAGEVRSPSAAEEPALRHLERELEQTRAYLRTTVSQYEVSTEEMKASNEELQAMNEELRSATEELETSREELQSINEELSTVNSEMKGKVDELAVINSDLQNLMASTCIATVFLDRELAIKRYTPQAVELFHLIPGDLGRPLQDLRYRLEYPHLISDAEQVLRSLVPMEREVQDGERWFLARLQPYRTVEDHIAGVVLTCVDVSERRHFAQALEADLAATTLLSEIARQLISEGEVETLLGTILEAGLTIMHADAGTVQLLEEGSGLLRMLGQRGIPPHMARHFAVVDASSGSACRAALEERRRVMVSYAADQPDPFGALHWHREEAGFATGQSTPLVGRSGRLIGVISTHWKRPYAPNEREQRFFDLLARQAADAVERKQSDDLLHEQMHDLQRFNAVAVGRESRMIDLKMEVNELLGRLGEAPRYVPIAEEEKG